VASAGHPAGRLVPVYYFSAFFAASVFLLIAAASAHYFVGYQAERLEREASEEVNVELAGSVVTSDLDSVATDLRFLVSVVEARDSVRKQALCSRRASPGCSFCLPARSGFTTKFGCSTNEGKNRSGSTSTTASRQL